MRTSRLSCRPSRLTRSSSCVTSRPSPTMRSNNGPNSGTATWIGTLRRVSSHPKSRRPERFTKVTAPCASSPTTPEVTELSTLSNRRWRRSIWAVLSKSVSRCTFSCRVIWLKYRPNMAISSSPSSSLTVTSKSPAPTRCAAPVERPTGRDSRSANHKPKNTAAIIKSTAKPK